MDDISDFVILLITGGVVITAVGTIWLCVNADRVAKALIHSDRAEVRAAITDSLARIESASDALKIATSNLTQAVNAGNERTEQRDASVARDLADSIHRADAQPRNADYGAAADAALRSPEDQSS